jgi:acetyl esterase/lipase
MKWLASVVLIAVVALVPTSAQEPEKLPVVKVERSIPYSTAGGEKLMLDLAAPETGGPYPAVVLLHGGAWMTGNRADLSRSQRNKDSSLTPSLIEQIAARGYVVTSASYRLAPKHKFPAQIDDVRTAIRFLRENAKKYNLLPEKVAVGGFSAGGHLALLAGFANKDAFSNVEYPNQSSRVQSVVSFFGPTDLSLYAASEGLEDAYMVPWLGKACKMDKSVYTKASPINCVTKDAPPVLMIHGTADFIVPVLHSERLHKKLEDLGVKSELITVKGEGHGWNGKVAAGTTQEALRFLEENLKGKK